MRELAQVLTSAARLNAGGRRIGRRETMKWLANDGMTGLLHRTVLVLNDSNGHANQRTRTIVAQ